MPCLVRGIPVRLNFLVDPPIMIIWEGRLVQKRN